MRGSPDYNPVWFDPGSPEPAPITASDQPLDATAERGARARIAYYAQILSAEAMVMEKINLIDTVSYIMDALEEL